MRIAGWGLAVAAIAFFAGPALAHYSKNYRPYTIEKVCGENGRPCHLHMIYAPGHNPAGAIPDGYWYSAKKAYKHRSPYAACRGFNCWYRHAPEHRY